MSDTVRITIDDKEYQVPAGMNLVDAAKWHADNDIPVFCYHPKMEPVGMCRMCIVEMGAEQKDRETGEPVLDEDGNQQIRWFPKLQTACTQLCSDGLVIRTDSDWVKQSRENVLEFLLTSHPLDCPICDKGGECPLQTLTMRHGPDSSRMEFSDKMSLAKNVPLGDLIYLDRERCIQCARCIRFQEEIVGDDVLAFHERGRRLQIITNSDPGFKTYFSGNTTDICPVGALTTSDFRFGARPWELSEVASICPHSPSGANISLSTRLDRDFGGAIIKRIMPRQNEYVNEIWISDKTRFGHHFTRSQDRLLQPMVDGEPSTWDDAFAKVKAALDTADGDVAFIAGSGITNEDAWEIRQLADRLNTDRLGAWTGTSHTGMDLIAQVGVGQGTNLSELGVGDAVLVIASDLEEEEPIWRLRLKQAQDRGAYLVVANARHTRMEELATEGDRFGKPVAGAAIRYGVGDAAHVMHNLRQDHKEIAQQLADANNLVIVAGAEGLDMAGSRALMQACANFLIETNHAGKANSGLLSTAPGSNMMGLHYLGFTPENTQAIQENPPAVLFVAQAEILDDDPAAVWLDQVQHIITLSLFPDELAQRAAVALPIQSFAERDGSYTSGERRVQRFYTAQGPMGQALPLYKAMGQLRRALAMGMAKPSASAAMLEITQQVPAFAGCSYQALGQIERQYPDVGGTDKYYGGTAYQNTGGLGVQIPTTADNGEDVAVGEVNLPAKLQAADDELIIVPTTRLYNQQNIFKPTTQELADPRLMLMIPHVGLNSDDADELDVATGDVVVVDANGTMARVRAKVHSGVPKGVAVLPRHLGETATPMMVTTGTVSKVAEPEPAAV